MTNEILLESLKRIVEQEHSNFLRDIRTVLLDYRNAGGTQDKAQMIAEHLRTQFIDNELLEDRTLEILDIIEGWCNSDINIWN